VRRSSSASLGLAALLLVLAFALAGCGTLTAALDSPSAAPESRPLAALVPGKGRARVGDRHRDAPGSVLQAGPDLSPRGASPRAGDADRAGEPPYRRRRSPRSPAGPRSRTRAQ
jgi:hypothetical protein